MRDTEFKLKKGILIDDNKKEEINSPSTHLQQGIIHWVNRTDTKECMELAAFSESGDFADYWRPTAMDFR